MPSSSALRALDASLLIVLSGKPDDAQPLPSANSRRCRRTSAATRSSRCRSLLSRGPNRIGGPHVPAGDVEERLAAGRARRSSPSHRQQLVANDAPGARKSLEQALALKPDHFPAALTLSQMGPEERKEGIASLEKYVTAESEIA